MLPESKMVPMFIWVCENCGAEFPWEIEKLGHGISGAADCLACNVVPGQKVPFTPLSGNCGKCEK